VTTYKVQAGDTLGTIAAKFLGSSSRYKEIASANPQLKNINLLEIGQTLNIPAQSSALVPATIQPQASSAAPVLPTGSFMEKLLANKKLLILLALGVGAILYVKSKKK